MDICIQQPFALGTGMPDWAAVLIECVIIAVLVLATYTVLALFYILYERKALCLVPVSSRIYACG